jgi:hypothetical protein
LLLLWLPSLLETPDEVALEQEQVLEALDRQEAPGQEEQVLEAQQEAPGQEEQVLEVQQEAPGQEEQAFYQWDALGQ